MRFNFRGGGSADFQMRIADGLGMLEPRDQRADLAMNGNICRCATYVRIRAAIHQAAKSLES